MATLARSVEGVARRGSYKERQVLRVSVEKEGVEYRDRLTAITPRVLNALALAQKKARIITDEDRQKGCTELDWTLDVIHNASAMDDLDAAIDSYCKNKIDDQQLGKAVNEYIDNHRIRWIRGIAFRFIR